MTVPPVTPPPVTADNAIDETSLAPGNYVRTLILNDIFKLLIRVVTTLQSLATTQAERLTFLTQWQKAYTDLQNQIHTFVQGNGDGIQGDNEDASNARSDLNRLNSTFTQQLQNQQSVVSDDAKALQSNVNQSNDAVNNLSNFTTSIIQELSTILGSIFR
jgi:dsDNA-specific endonuclease/ATPase MutS2